MLPSVAPVAVLWTRLIGGGSAGPPRAARMSMSSAVTFSPGPRAGWPPSRPSPGRHGCSRRPQRRRSGLALRSSSPRASTSSPRGKTGACAAAARPSARSCTTTASRAAAAMSASASITGRRAPGAAGGDRRLGDLVPVAASWPACVRHAAHVGQAAGLRNGRLRTGATESAPRECPGMSLKLALQDRLGARDGRR